MLQPLFMWIVHEQINFIPDRIYIFMLSFFSFKKITFMKQSDKQLYGAGFS